MKGKRRNYWAESEESKRRTEQREREREREKRRNIVIKGIDWNEGSNEGPVKEFIREKMKVGAGVEITHMIRVEDKNTIIVATMKSMEEKVGVVEVVTTSRKTPHLVFS